MAGTLVRSDGRVLSIAKLRVGQEAYQLSGVAQSLDDYYTGRGEADGQWMGASAERLGLEGPVVGDDLRAVLAGMAPGSGGLSPNGEAIRPHPRRVPGFDLTFKAPKSVSVLYAVSDDPRVQGAILEAGEAAVRDTLAWLEREAIHVRRGTGNERFLADLAGRDPEAAEHARIRTLRARGVVAAVFRHRTSRSGDPLLHWHTLVANMAEGPDGRWTAFVHPDLYRVVRTAGEVFQTVLRDELTERLGIAWRPGRHVPEIAGVPQALCDQFSKRSRDIEVWLESTGTANDRRGRQQAVLSTRRAKPEVEGERFDAAWKAEALTAGWGPAAAEQLLSRLTPHTRADFDSVWRLPERSTPGQDSPVLADSVVGPEEWVASLMETLTAEDSTFTRSELVRAVATRLGEGATMATLERVVARTLASPSVVPVAADRPGGPRWTSAGLLEVEARFLATLDPARQPRTGIASAVVEAVVNARPALGDDQVAAVRAISASAGAVAVLVGPAGTGKTFTLDTVRAVYEAAGRRVIGAAPSARAAMELEAGAGVSASTLQRLTGRWSRGYDLPDACTVLVVDEAAMAGIRDLERVVTATVNAGGRVVLAGDHHQLPEVTAGGGFAAAATHNEVAVGVLSVNRRQQQPWEQAALVELRDGHVAAAVGAYRDHGRVIVADDSHVMLTAAVDRWFAAHTDGLSPVLLAGTNEIVDALNHTVRAELDERGLAGDVAGVFGDCEFRVGERVVLRRNSYREQTTTGADVAVFNGQTGTVTAATDDTLIVHIEATGTEIALPADYAACAVDYGYALTSHRAQGGTWDLAIGVGTDGLYREGGYLQLSRGRSENWLVVTAADLDRLDTDLDRHDRGLTHPDDDPDLDQDLIRRLNQSRAKLLASTHDPHAPHIAALAETAAFTDLDAWARYARRVEQHATAVTGIDPCVTEGIVARTLHTATHIAVGQTVKAFDRHNIGTVIGLDDRAGQVRVEFVSSDGERTAHRTLDWCDVQILTSQPRRRDLDAEASGCLHDATEQLTRSLDRWLGHLATAGVDRDDAHIYTRAASLRVARAANMLAAEQPAWLTQFLGPRPEHAVTSQVWDDTVRDIAAHHQRQADGIDIHAAPIGDALYQQVARARVWLAAHTDTPAVPITRTRTLDELHDRRRQLDAIFDTAPDDQRPLINRLRAGDQLSFDDTTELLADALAAQDARHRWILAHWPHIVEYAETNRTIQHGISGPDVSPYLTTLATHSHECVAAAASNSEPWLVRLLAAVAPADGTDLSDPAAKLAVAVADYRARWSITAPDPLGDSVHSFDQSVERELLVESLDEFTTQATAERLAPVPALNLDL